jgi:hypothetical protein
MTKLFDIPQPVRAAPAPTGASSWDRQWQALERHTAAYDAACEVSESLAHESMTGEGVVSPSLTRAYVRSLCVQLGLDYERDYRVSMESRSFESGSLALEGFIGDLWHKIMSFFASLFKSAQEFYGKNITKLGRLGKSLENIETALKQTNADLHGDASPEYSGSLLKKCAGHSQVDLKTITELVDSCNTFCAGMREIVAGAKRLADVGLVDANFIRETKELKEMALKATASKNDTKAERPGLIKSAFNKDERADRRQLNAQAKTFAEISKSAHDEAGARDAEIEKSSKLDMGSEEANNEAGKKGFELFLNLAKESMQKVVDKTFVEGNKIIAVKTTDAGSLEVELDKSPKEATGVTLAKRAALIKLVRSTSEMLKATDDAMKGFGPVNDKINKGLDAIDRLVKDIDKIDPVKYGRYRNALQQRFRVRLSLSRNFFSTYNKIGKNCLDYSVKTAEAVVDYSALSMKHFSENA